MEIAYHIGSHCTDDGMIQDCLAKNHRRLIQDGILILPPGKFRRTIREAIRELNGDAASPEFQADMLKTMSRRSDAERVVFSNPSFICNVERLLVDDVLYADAPEKVAKLTNLFAGQEVEFFLSMRNPATFLPACFETTNADSFEAYVAQIDPMTILWSDLIRRIVAANPGISLTVWANEDAPFVWNDVLRSMSGHGEDVALEGSDDFLSTIMSEEGLERMRLYLKTQPADTEVQRRRIVGAFLDKFAISEVVEPELNCPGWSAEYVEELTAIYELDLQEIEKLEGVNFIGA